MLKKAILGCSAIIIFGAASYVFAQTPSSTVPGTPTFQSTAPAAARGNPERRKFRREMLNEWCTNHPDKCKEYRQNLREARDEWCAKHPDDCNKMKNQLEGWCKEHPERCKRFR